jgi:hypothetical protein
MPRAGWCRDCGEWVWVDEQEACQNGHGPECVTGIHEAEPQPDPFQPAEQPPADPAIAVASPAPIAEQGFGVGEMPDSVYRFNWGAFFLPPVWGIVYGAWPVVTLWMLTLLVPLFATSLFGLAESGSTAAALATATVITEIIVGIARLWIGANASTWVWKREAARLQFFEGSQPRFSVGKFLSRQRVWLWAGAGLQVFSGFSVLMLSIAPAELFAQVEKQWGMTRLDLGLSVLWLIAEALLGLWLASQMRKERPGTPRPAGDAL